MHVVRYEKNDNTRAYDHGVEISDIIYSKMPKKALDHTTRAKSQALLSMCF